MDNETKPTNRLSREKSPYLLQHQYNPVDWYPWGDEAFEKASKEDKLIFLSIGYSTCHWCHVMERESFEDTAVAELINEHFVPVKVDREERTDIDQIYMNAVQALTGSGGWPLTVFLTPDRKPVTGGTYFPPEDRWGRPGMKTILPKLASLWKSDREEMLKASEQMTQILQPRFQTSQEWQPNENMLQKAFEQLRSSYDPQYGGFGQAPKFPRSHDLSFLLRYWKRTKEPQALEMVTKTLDCMAQGGIWDHLGGGFARYSTDQQWLVPHFEKMLYDQAILLRTYVEGYQATQNATYKSVAKEISEYVLRDLTDPQGGFYSAEDADSEGMEGKFYVWTPKEINDILEPDEAKVYCAYYQVTEQGNFEHQTSILHTPKDIPAIAEAIGMDIDSFNRLLASGRSKTLETRNKRIRPHLDDKVLTSWNGLMISSLAFAGRVFGEQKYVDAAQRAAKFILEKVSVEGRLYRRYRDGETVLTGYHDDYAFFIMGLLDLYEATFDVMWFQEAKRLLMEMIDLFEDDIHGGFYFSASDAEKLIARTKEYYDGAVPSGNSVAVLNLLRVARMTGDIELEKKGLKVLQSNYELISQHPVNFTQSLNAVDFMLGPSHEIVVVQGVDLDEYHETMRLLNQSFNPRCVLMQVPNQSAEKVHREIPITNDKAIKDNKTTTYVCRDFSCQAPVTSSEELKSVLEGNH